MNRRSLFGWVSLLGLGCFYKPGEDLKKDEVKEIQMGDEIYWVTSTLDRNKKAFLFKSGPFRVINSTKDQVCFSTPLYYSDIVFVDRDEIFLTAEAANEELEKIKIVLTAEGYEVII